MANNIVVAIYRCVSCFYEWNMPIYDRESKRNPAECCPKCGSVYFTWLNYESK